MTRWVGGSFCARTVAARIPPYEPPSTTTFWVCASEASAGAAEPAWLVVKGAARVDEDAEVEAAKAAEAAGFFMRIDCAMTEGKCRRDW